VGSPLGADAPATAPTHGPLQAADVLGYLREQGITLTWAQATGARRAKAADAATSISVKAG
jgi:ABC-type nitrate/sulfonate/bicarbonate transport system substrate-binding protein